MAEGKQHALAVGITSMSTDDMQVKLILVRLIHDLVNNVILFL